MKSPPVGKLVASAEIFTGLYCDKFAFLERQMFDFFIDTHSDPM